jgi:nucleotide-binding universal stress UspA family protein
MSIVIQPRRPPADHAGMRRRSASPPTEARPARPVVAAVESTSAGRAVAAEAATRARELGAPLVLVHVRRGPSGVWGTPFFQRRLERALRAGREALAAAAAQARAAGVEPEAEILEGAPARRIAEFARGRDAQLVIVGPRRRRAIASVVRRVAAGGVPVARAGPGPGPALSKAGA